LGGNPVEIDRGGDMLDPVKGSSLKLEIYSETDFAYEDFFTANYGTYKIELIKDPNGTPETKWVGFNESRTYSEPFIDTPYPSSIKFTDGLAHLKFELFEDSGSPYAGNKSLIEVIRLCTNQLPEGLSVREVINVFEDDFNDTSTDSPLNQAYIDTGLFKEKDDKGSESDFKGWDCRKVLDEICRIFGATMFQSEGKWWIVKITELKASPLTWREYLPRVGSESTITVDSTGTTNQELSITNVDAGNPLELTWLNRDAELTTIEPINRLRIQYTTQNIDYNANNIIQNGCFQTIVGGTSAPFPLNWTFGSAVDPSNYTAIHGAANGHFFRFENPDQKQASAQDLNRWIQYTTPAVPTATTDTLDLRFKYSMKVTATLSTNATLRQQAVNFMSSSSKVTWVTTIQIGTYYLVGTPSTGYVWQTTPGSALLERTGINMTPLPGNSNVNTNGTIQLTTPTLPQTGSFDFTIRVFRAYHNIYTYDQSDANNSIELTYLDQNCFEAIYLPNNNIPEEDVIIYAEIDEEEELEEVEVLIGDGPNTISQGSLRLSTGVITDAWHRRGVVETQTLIDLMVITYEDLRGDFINSLSGKLAGNFEFYNTLLSTVNAVGTKYMINEHTWSVKTMEHSVDLIELASFEGTTPITQVDGTTPLFIPPVENSNTGFSQPDNSGNSSTERVLYETPNLINSIDDVDAQNYPTG
jgi:hypothetical protein